MAKKFTKRVTGQMTKLKGDRIGKFYLFLDTETKVPLKSNDIRDFDLILGIATFIELDINLTIKQKVEHRFRTIDEFIEILTYHSRSRNVLTVFAHNIGFDIRVLNLPEVFDSMGFESEPPIINQMVFIWRVKSEQGTYLFLDTANLGVRSVSLLGDDMGFPKQIINFDECSIDDLFTYCARDVDILIKFVIEYIKYIDINGLGSFKTTLASQALSSLRTRFNNNLPHIHNDLDAIKLERLAYHGGRVECFALGKQPKQNWFYLDVNSMYPFAMKGDDLPTQFLGYSENVRMKEFKIRMKHSYVIADVLVDTDEPVYPLLRKDKLIFPIGKFRTQLCHPELLYAMERGHVKKIYSSAQYKMGSVLDEYVDFFYADKNKYKTERNNTYYTIAKLYLNSGYGKLGQTEPHREFYCETDFKGVYREPSNDLEECLHFQYIAWYGKIFKEYRQGETSFSCPYLAAAITAKSRMLLWMYIKLAGKENVKYCDTDSLTVNARGYRRLFPHIHQSRLGALKLETSSKTFIIYGNKDYIFGEISRHKGIPTKAEEISKEKWEYLEFEGFIRWMNRGASGSPKGEFKTKTRKSIYNKGVINENNTVSPFTLNEGECFALLCRS